MGAHDDVNNDGIADHGEHPPAMTAGQEDHSDPWAYAGDDVEGPTPGEVPDGVA